MGAMADLGTALPRLLLAPARRERVLHEHLVLPRPADTADWISRTICSMS